MSRGLITRLRRLLKVVLPVDAIRYVAESSLAPLFSPPCFRVCVCKVDIRGPLSLRVSNSEWHALEVTSLLFRQPVAHNGPPEVEAWL